MTAYRVNEVFDTLQGEGTYTGRACTFIRLQGCPVGCAWCDTKYTWSAGAPATWEQVLAKMMGHHDESCAEVDEHFLAEQMEQRGAGHVVISGGEPALYDLLPLTRALFDRDITSQVETSGTHPLSVHENTWVTCSPKLDKPGGFMVLRSVLERADEIKMPVGKVRDIEDLKRRVLPFTADHPVVYLQPLSMSQKATALCIQAARENRWSVSLQVHKLAGLR